MVGPRSARNLKVPPRKRAISTKFLHCWKIQKLISSLTGHPDTQREYWLVTLPDGTQYRFGGEFDPDKNNADQNSAFYVPVYDQGACSAVSAYWVCDKVWRWNLDRVEDTDGNVIAYYYDQEINYYQARNLLRRAYVRAGNVARLEYGRRTGATTTPTQVLFNTEERCEGACTWPANYPDTPGDLTCAATGTCTQTGPTFWSRKRLNTIQPQYFNPETGQWVTVALYDLDYEFPYAPPDAYGNTSEKKLFLNHITQKLADGSAGLPPVQYGYTLLENRRDYYAVGNSPLTMPRIGTITGELGGVTTFT